MKICWVLFNSFSNKDKIDTFKKSKVPKGLKVEFVETNSLVLKNTSNGDEVLLNNGKAISNSLPNFVVSLIPDEKNDKVGYKILEYLESQKTIILNSVKSARLATDKYTSNVLLSKNGFKVPETLLFSKDSKISYIKYPCVIKPVDGRKSRGVKILEDKSQFKEYISESKDEMLIIQDFISESFRKDIRTFIFNGKFLGAIKRTATAKTFSSVIYEEIKLSKEEQLKAVSVAKLFGLTFCSVDFFVDEDRTICEVNANPGFKALENHVTKDITEYIYNYFLNIFPA